MHARASSRAGARLVAVCDLDESRARALAGGAPTFATLDALLATVQADVVHLCTPVEAHADAIVAAVGRGAHVIVEKPAAADAASTHAALEAAARAERTVVPVHQFLFQQGVRRLLARRSDLGRLVRCAFVAASAGAERTGVSPARLVAEVLPHPLSIFARLSPVDLAALDWTVVAPAPGELRALTIAGDLTLDITITSSGRPTRTLLEVTGTEATGVADLFHGFAVLDRGRATRVRKLTRPFTTSTSTLAAASANLVLRSARRETAYPGLEQLVRTTYDAIAGRGPLPIAPAEVVAVAEARDRILRAVGAAA